MSFAGTEALISFSADLHSLFIRTSNFGAEAEPSYFFAWFKPENVLNMFLKL